MFGLLLSAMLVLPACNDIINYPAPRTQSLSPNSISAGQPQFNLTVSGFSFTPASLVEWDNTPLITIFQGVNTLTAQVPAALIQNPGAARRLHSSSTSIPLPRLCHGLPISRPPGCLRAAAPSSFTSRAPISFPA